MALPALLRGLVAFEQAISDRLDRGDEIALLGLRVDLDPGNTIDLEIVIPSAASSLALRSRTMSGLVMV